MASVTLTYRKNTPFKERSRSTKRIGFQIILWFVPSELAFVPHPINLCILVHVGHLIDLLARVGPTLGMMLYEG